MQIQTFSGNVDYASRLRSMALYAKVLIQHGTKEFQALSLVPIDKKVDHHSTRSDRSDRTISHK